MLNRSLLLLILSVSLFSEARDLSLASIEGKNLFSGKDFEVSLKDHDATVVLFVSSQCACSQSHVQHLKELATQFTKYAFVGVISNVDEDVEKAKAYFKEVGVGFSVILDRSAKLADSFGAVKTPQVFVVNKSGEVLFYGGVTDSSIAASASKFYLREALYTIQNGQKPKPKEAKSLGCMIQRS
jgi:thioredoxin-related protein